MTFIHSVQSISVERFELLKVQIKKRTPFQYPGQNIESLAKDYRQDTKVLTSAGQYTHYLTLGMLKSFLLIG